MPRWLLIACLTATACGSPPGASYSGTRERPLTSAARVQTLDAVPPGYERLGRVSARCTSPRDYQVLVEEPLANVDCSVARLDRALRERAAEVGGEFLAKRECSRTERERSCEAQVVRPGDDMLVTRRPEAKAAAESAPAPGPDEVAHLEEPNVSSSWVIKLSFDSRMPYARPKRTPGEVGRSGQKPPQLQDLGDMEARCDNHECDAAELTNALRIAASHLGADSLSDVRCFDDRRGSACVGSLGAAELP
ncbi:MAG TPA: hypothetical protein VM686_26630 [Polyangiaceae bacterium]|nr:hypothetical protein [Polyangiaceae bacterium]